MSHVTRMTTSHITHTEVTAAGGKRVFDVTGPDTLTMSQVWMSHVTHLTES
jgi:hypothetical protein